jgi:hypothetical protein
MEADKGFITQTAHDYNLSYETVEKISKMAENVTDFYERLEEELRSRGSISC